MKTLPKYNLGEVVTKTFPPKQKSIMRSQIQALFDKAETDRNQLLSHLSTKTEQELNFKPSPESWSMIQVAHHLIQAETGVYLYLKKKTQYPDTIQKDDWTSYLRGMVLKAFMALPFKWKAPTYAAKVPDSASIQETKRLWDQTRVNLKEVFDGIPEDLLSKQIFKHPVAGRVNAYWTMKFVEDHVLRHKKQIQGIEQAFANQN